jgi:hypothetical protein
MDHTYWQRQGSDQPLFPDLLWSRPENRTQAGKLLVIGGNAFGFAAPAEAYQEAIKAGVGVVRVLLPDKLKHTVGKILDVGDFAATTPSGSFSQRALDTFLVDASWADSVLLAGDVGRNAETAIVLETFATHYHGQLTITKDALDYFTSAPNSLLNRPHTTIVASFAHLQKLAISSKFVHAFTFSMGLLQLIEALHIFSSAYSINIIVQHLDTLLVASRGTISTTHTASSTGFWRVTTAAHASVWWLQNPSKPFEAFTTAVHSLNK